MRDIVVKTKLEHIEGIESGKTHNVLTIIDSTRKYITVTAEEVLKCDSRLQRGCVVWSLMHEKLERKP